MREYENLYPIDLEDPTEMARLQLQDRLFTNAMGGVFHKDIDLSGVETLLDVACGPGEWALEAAFTHPTIEVTAIDLSQSMIAYASTQAQVRGLANVTFRVMDVTKPLDFPDAGFDLVNARMLFAIMRRKTWPTALAEWHRILRPGGMVCWTEVEGVGVSNSPAYEELTRLSSRALWKAGQSFSPDGWHLGLVPVMGKLLRDAGFTITAKYGYIHESSAGTPGWTVSYQDTIVGFALAKPHMTRMGVISEQKFDELYQQLQRDLENPDHCSAACIVSWWAMKPY